MTGTRHRLSHLNYMDEPHQEEITDSYIADDLALFTNAQFFDFDMGPTIPSEELFNTANEPTRQAPNGQVDPTLNFVDYGEFDFSGALTDLPTTISTTIEAPTTTAAPSTLSQTRYNPPTLLPNAPIAPVAPTANTSSTDQPSPNSSTSLVGTKRKASTSLSEDGSQQFNLEDASRIAAEEDKRRRNTAASARSRIKKKQREQALERTAKEMSEKVGKLEARINQLEMENKWLKNLITEKNGSNSKEEIAELFASKFSSAQTSLSKEKEEKK